MNTLPKTLNILIFFFQWIFLLISLEVAVGNSFLFNRYDSSIYLAASLFWIIFLSFPVFLIRFSGIKWFKILSYAFLLSLFSILILFFSTLPLNGLVDEEALSYFVQHPGIYEGPSYALKAEECKNIDLKNTLYGGENTEKCRVLIYKNHVGAINFYFTEGKIIFRTTLVLPISIPFLFGRAAH